MLSSAIFYVLGQAQFSFLCLVCKYHTVRYCPDLVLGKWRCLCMRGFSKNRISLKNFTVFSSLDWERREERRGLPFQSVYFLCHFWFLIGKPKKAKKKFKGEKTPDAGCSELLGPEFLVFYSQAPVNFCSSRGILKSSLFHGSQGNKQLNNPHNYQLSFPKLPQNILGSTFLHLWERIIFQSIPLAPWIAAAWLPFLRKPSIPSTLVSLVPGAKSLAETEEPKSGESQRFNPQL